MDDNQFRMLLDHLGYSWDGYRKVRKGVKKRIHRQMQRLGCRDIMAYLNLLEDQPALRQESEWLLTVSISRFFRDRRLWEMLERQFLPDILATLPPKMKVWSAGCAGGEEVYSFKIIWERLAKAGHRLPELDVLATDRHPQYLGRARRGVYPVSSLREVPFDMRALFFEPLGGGKQFVIRDALRGNICWQTHDVFTAPPGCKFNIVFLRNSVLTYYRPERQKKMLPSVLNALAPAGLFIIGCHETLPGTIPVLVPLALLPYVFRKRS
jgi:chemotaxis methyl-accepting protein methylase